MTKQKYLAPLFFYIYFQINKTYAKPDTSNSNACGCQTGFIKASTGRDANGAITGYECIICSSLTAGPGVDASGCTCAANAIPDSAGVCQCLPGEIILFKN